MRWGKAEHPEWGNLCDQDEERRAWRHLVGSLENLRRCGELLGMEEHLEWGIYFGLCEEMRAEGCHVVGLEYLQPRRAMVERARIHEEGRAKNGHTHLCSCRPPGSGPCHACVAARATTR